MKTEETTVLRFCITNEGTLGEEYRLAPTSSPASTAAQPGAALADLLACAEEEDEDWGGDAPDVSVDFARLNSSEPEPIPKALPPTADFAPDGQGGMVLLRWPRLARPARLPRFVAGQPLTAIAATAFAPLHIPEGKFGEMYSSPVSFSVFCMRMGRHTTTEPRDEGGPEEITLPDSVTRIGPYAFWRCTRLKRIALPPDISELPAGCFGECTALEEIHLPDRLRTIGWTPALTDQVMPDVGVFAGCHALRELTLPAGVQALGAHTFNSAGLVRLRVIDGPSLEWSRTVNAAATAFDHTAALLWLEKLDPGGRVLYALGLPPARDKILSSDARFGQLLRIPSAFFQNGPEFFDQMAQNAFRLDFSARMALARLACPSGLDEGARQWYLALLVQYFGRAPQFMPDTPGEEAYSRLFDFLAEQPGLTAAHLSELVRTAGRLGLSAPLITRMLEVRTQRFSTATGFEDLELD